MIVYVNVVTNQMHKVYFTMKVIPIKSKGAMKIKNGSTKTVLPFHLNSKQYLRIP